MENQFLQKHEQTDFSPEKQKTEKETQFSFDVLRKSVEKISEPEDKMQVMEFVDELERYCQEYVKIEQAYRQAWNKLQENVSKNQEERENDLKELETWMQAKVSKKNVIADDLNILSRLFLSYGLDTSWHHGFGDENDFETWIIKQAKN